MSNIVAKKSDISLFEFAQGVSEKLQDVKIAVDETRGLATATGVHGGKRVSMRIETSDLGTRRTTTDYKILDRKSDYKDEVKRLKKLGLKQREIALELGISQTLVSNLLNK